MRVLLLEYTKVVTAIIVTLFFFSIWAWLVYDRDDGIPAVIDTYVQEPIMYKEVGKNVYESIKVPYFSVSDTKSFNIVGTKLAGCDNKAFNYYYVSVDELKSGITVANMNGANYIINLEVYKPNISSTGEVVLNQIHAKDSYGNLLYKADGSPVITNAVDYNKTFVDNYTYNSSLNVNKLPDAYQASSKRGYDYVGVQNIDGKEVVIFNDFYPLKIVATYRCLVGTLKAEYTAVYYAGGSVNGSDINLGYDEYEQWYGD